MDLKKVICEYLSEIISERMSELQSAIDAGRESRDADSKSSVGDKHETSRALAQIEIDKLEVQLNKTMILQQELNMINPVKKCTKVEFGSLVFTSQEKYFISIGMGKVQMDNQTYYAISIHSPVAEALKAKRKGEKIFFQGREIVIEEIF